MSDNDIIDKDTRFKMVFFLIVIIFLLGIYYITKSYVENQDKDQEASSDVIVKSITDDFYKNNPLSNPNDDNDGDGIVNWREDLYGLDRNKIDNEQLNGRIASSTGKSTDINRQTNLTETVAKDVYLLGQYNKNGQASTSSYDVLAEEIINTIKPKLYTGEVKTINNPTAAQLKKYGNEMADGFRFLYSFSDYKKELTYLNDDNNKKRVEILYKELNRACSPNNWEIVTIPTKYKDTHIKTIYMCNLYAEYLNAILKKDKDSLRYQVAANFFIETLSLRTEILAEYSILFKEDNISWKDGEKGVIFEAIDKIGDINN